MVIETDARRFIVDAIKIENQLNNMEKNFMKKGTVFFTNNKEYNELRA